jgi:hypothetical protein
LKFRQRRMMLRARRDHVIAGRFTQSKIRPDFGGQSPRANTCGFANAKSDSTLPTNGICRKFAMKLAATGGFCTANFSGRKIYCAARSIGCGCHLRYARFHGSHAGPTLRVYDFCVRLHPVNKGGTCRGPYLEAQRTGSMRRIRFCRRDFAGCILSSRGRRRRQTKNCRCKTGRGIQTPESQTLRCFVFAFRCRPGRAKRGLRTTRRPFYAATMLGDACRW